MADHNAVPYLNHLISINRDAEAGLLSAASQIQNSELETQFKNYAKQHAKFAAELEAEVKHLGEAPSESGTVGGALHRGWLDLKATLTGHSAASILASCETGEESAESAYTTAVRDSPSGRLQTLIESQLSQIKGFRKRLARLVEQTKDGVDFQKNE